MVNQATEEAFARLKKWSEYQPEASSKESKSAVKTVPSELIREFLSQFDEKDADYNKEILFSEATQALRANLALKQPSCFAEILAHLAVNQRLFCDGDEWCNAIESLLSRWSDSPDGKTVSSFTALVEVLKRLSLSEDYNRMVKSAGRALAILRAHLKRDYRSSGAHIDALWLSMFNAPVRLVTIFRRDIAFIESASPSDRVKLKLKNCCLNSKIVRSFTVDYQNAAQLYDDFSIQEANKQAQAALNLLVNTIGIDALSRDEQDLATGGYAKLFRELVMEREANSIMSKGSPSAASILQSIFR